MIHVAILLVSLMIIFVTVVSTWSLLPRGKIDNWFVQCTIWLSWPLRGPAIARVAFVALPLIYFTFGKMLAGGATVVAMTLLTLFHWRWVQYLALMQRKKRIA
jgi:hypothetical protein